MIAVTKVMVKLCNRCHGLEKRAFVSSHTGC